METDKVVSVDMFQALFLYLGSRTDSTMLYLSCECGRLPFIFLCSRPRKSKPTWPLAKLSSMRECVLWKSYTRQRVADSTIYKVKRMGKKHELNGKQKEERWDELIEYSRHSWVTCVWIIRFCYSCEASCSTLPRAMCKSWMTVKKASDNLMDFCGSVRKHSQGGSWMCTLFVLVTFAKSSSAHHWLAVFFFVFASCLWILVYL